MSRKTQRNESIRNARTRRRRRRPGPAAARGREILTWSVVAVLLVAAVWMLLFNGKATQPSQPVLTTNAAALASEHSPMLGAANAKVHIVEILDPACETCATFYPFVKQMLADNPDEIRLSIRHVPFHAGLGVRGPAARGEPQARQVLADAGRPAGLASPVGAHHTVQPDLVWPAIAGRRVEHRSADGRHECPEVEQRMQRDIDDARALKVTATPEYFVNGRPLPSFGLQQLQDLVVEALETAY